MHKFACALSDLGCPILLTARVNFEKILLSLLTIHEQRIPLPQEENNAIKNHCSMLMGKGGYVRYKKMRKLVLGKKYFAFVIHFPKKKC